MTNNKAKKLIIANWKLNPMTVKEAVQLARAEDKAGVVIAPPFPFLKEVGAVLKRAQLGAQDAFWIAKGAYTGEVSASQLKRLQVSHIIVGHSERRALGETDAMVNRKVKAIFAEGLVVVLCIGEPWNIRKKGLSAAKRFVATQLRAGLVGITSRDLTAKNLIIAYEPVWAIGTGKADVPSESAEMARFIKKLLVISHKSSVKVLYGGSVTAVNAALFLKERMIDGALVGGTSLSPKRFKEIIASAKV